MLAQKDTVCHCLGQLYITISKSLFLEMYLTPLTNTQTVNSAPNKTTVPLQIASAQAITSSFWPQLKKHSLVRTEHYISLSWYSFTTQEICSGNHHSNYRNRQQRPWALAWQRRTPHLPGFSKKN